MNKKLVQKPRESRETGVAIYATHIRNRARDRDKGGDFWGIYGRLSGIGSRN
jgi:hypothetical protein